MSLGTHHLDWESFIGYEIATAGLFGQFIIVYHTYEYTYDIYIIPIPGFRDSKLYKDIDPLLALSMFYDYFEYSPWRWWKELQLWWRGPKKLQLD